LQVFSAFGFVQKIAIFEKNGFQALIQYPCQNQLLLHKIHLFVQSMSFKSFMLFSVDIQTAAAAKEALEGHSIYEGEYCKLHLAFSRHTELNVKVVFTI
jgi:polypyrimidine tract-binding protein 2